MRHTISCDCTNIARDETLAWDRLAGKTVVITGATGLIGQTLTGALLAREQLAPSGLQVVCLVRNLDRARALLGPSPALCLVSWDATAPFQGLDDLGPVDAIVHAANITDSASFVERPVEVIETTVESTRAMLALAHRDQARLVVLSTLETYGELESEGPIAEDEGGFLDAMVVRNSYPEAKRLDEALVAAYASQYGTPALVLRLTQTFGPGVPQNDGRVFAYFARCALQGTDIVLATDGSKENAYLYTADAARAILVALARGARGRAYNVANDATYCSVRQMAELVAKTFGNGRMAVRIELDEAAARRFRKGTRLRLDTSAIEALGWKPLTGLVESYERLLADWNESHE